MMSRAELAKGWNRFWFESEIMRVRLTMFRVVFFVLLGFDMWVLMVPHAPRHDIGAFNVSDIPILDGFLPPPTAMAFTALYLIGGFLALRIALGLAQRASVVALTIIYSAAFFWSQVDSYQHHYLICLLLFLCCFVPFDQTPGLDRAYDESDPPKLHSWAARLMYVEVSVVYFFTAVTKVDEHWLNGWALERIIQVDYVREFYTAINESLGWSELGMYSFVAHTIMLWQFFVAVAFLFPKLRGLACVTGPIFHILIEVIDLKIGWFSYYMIGIYYILLFPDHWFMAIAKPAGRALSGVGRWFVKIVEAREDPSAFVAVGAAILCFIITLYVPLVGAGITAIACALAALVALWPRAEQPTTSSVTRAIAHAAVALAMVLSIRGTDAAYDYYRFWAGDLARRGHIERAAEMYERANAAHEGEPARHFRLAAIYEQLGRTRDAAHAYRQGLGLEPDDAPARAALEALDARSGR